MRSAASRFHCSSAGSRAAKRGPEPVAGQLAAGAAGAAAGPEAAGAGAAGEEAGGVEPQPATTTIAEAIVAWSRHVRFNMVQYLASSPTVQDRPGAGSKNRPLLSLTITEPMYRASSTLSMRKKARSFQLPATNGR